MRIANERKALMLQNQVITKMFKFRYSNLRSRNQTGFKVSLLSHPFQHPAHPLPMPRKDPSEQAFTEEEHFTLGIKS